MQLSRKRLRAWFRKNQRELPWRENTSKIADQRRGAYRVWVAEAMLQQTQVTTVIKSYINWMKLFPNVHTLAWAKEEKVLMRREGLGYYRRALNHFMQLQKSLSMNTPAGFK